MAYTLPADVDERPVAVDGAGTVGRRIAAVYAAGGSQVRIFDPSPDQCDAAIAFCTEQVDDFKKPSALLLSGPVLWRSRTTWRPPCGARGWSSKPRPRSSN